jgi:holo-[acyl-carrier protein] synthase
MIVGTGTDIVDIWRIKRAIERHGDRFVRRVYTAAEVEYCGTGIAAYQRFAARFAAKEAAAKALGTGFGREVHLTDIEVQKDDRGKPVLKLAGGAAAVAASLGVTRFHVSLSHSLKMATAFVVLETDG